MQILMFLHCWSPEKHLYPPYDNFVNAFLQLGNNVEIIWSNELINNMSSFSDVISEELLVGHIRHLNPDLVISVNNGGMTKTVRAGIECPVIKWLFDDYPHLFFSDDKEDLFATMKAEDRIVCYSSNLVQQVRERHPGMKDVISFIPHAATYAAVPLKDTVPHFNISFVGSALNYQHYESLLRHYNSRDPSISVKLVDAIEALRRDYNQPFRELINNIGLQKVLDELKSDGWDLLELKRAISDVISSQDRMNAIHCLADLGVGLYGNVEWLDSIAFSSGIARSYQFGSTITTSEELVQVYQDAKISIDIPNIQNINTLSNRVFDIMASSSMLITKYQKNSDAWKVFGIDCPVPMYNDLNHLRYLCTYYLGHEEERLSIVAKCNEIIRSGNTYVDRARAAFSLVGLKVIDKAKEGTVSIASIDRLKKKQ